MTDRFDTQALKPDELSSPPQEAACSGVMGGGGAGPLTGGTELTAECNVKARCHSHNVWGNEMNSLSGFLLSAMPKNTVLSAQMEQAWFWRTAWCKLQTSHCAYQ